GWAKPSRILARSQQRISPARSPGAGEVVTSPAAVPVCRFKRPSRHYLRWFSRTRRDSGGQHARSDSFRQAHLHGPFMDRLKAAGIAEDQARAHAEAMHEALRESMV